MVVQCGLGLRLTTAADRGPGPTHSLLAAHDLERGRSQDLRRKRIDALLVWVRLAQFFERCRLHDSLQVRVETRPCRLDAPSVPDGTRPGLVAHSDASGS